MYVYCGLFVDFSFLLCFLIFDPLGQPKVTAGRNHCFRTCCPFVRPQFSISRKTKQSENNVRYGRDCGSGRVDN